MSRSCQGQPLIVVGGWGVKAAMLDVVVSSWPSTVHYESLSDGLLTACDSISEVAQFLCRRHPDPATWLGWSQGAQVVLAAADLPDTPVESLVTVAGFPCFVENDQWPSGMRHDRFQAFRTGLNSDVGRTWRRFQQLLVHGCPDQERAEARRDLATWVESGPAASESQLAKSLNWLASEDQREVWSRVSAPALHLLGDADALVSPWHRYLSLPESAECQVLSGMTHWPRGQHANICRQAITEFMASMTQRQETV